MKLLDRYKVLFLYFFGISLFALPFLEKRNLLWGYLLVLLLSSCFLFVRNKQIFIVLLVLISLIHLQWGLAQFVAQSDVNQTFLGESRLADDIDGVAKFGVNKTVRPYGPYKHANSFAGIAVMSLLFLFTLTGQRPRFVVWRLIFVFISLSVFISFSRAAILALFFVVLFVLWRNDLRKFYIRSILLLFVVGALFLPFWLQRADDVEDKALTDRLSGYFWAKEIVADNFWGVGIGNYKATLKNYLDDSGVTYKPWEVDYVHCVPLLVVATIGVLPALLLFSFIFYLLFSKNIFYGLLLVFLLPILLLDHYLLTQATPLLYFVLLMII